MWILVISLQQINAQLLNILCLKSPFLQNLFAAVSPPSRASACSGRMDWYHSESLCLLYVSLRAYSVAALCDLLKKPIAISTHTNSNIQSCIIIAPNEQCMTLTNWFLFWRMVRLWILKLVNFSRATVYLRKHFLVNEVADEWNRADRFSIFYLALILEFSKMPRTIHRSTQGSWTFVQRWGVYVWPLIIFVHVAGDSTRATSAQPVSWKFTEIFDEIKIIWMQVTSR